MANMSYCRFQNTVVDLQDCFDHIDDEDLSKEENRARTHLVTVCRQIAAMFDDEADDSFDELEERIATLNAAITDSQAYNKELVGQLAKKQNENNQLQEQLEFAVKAACQSNNHSKRACTGHLWQCSNCGKLVCCAEGTDSQHNMCDSCWSDGKDYSEGCKP